MSRKTHPICSQSLHPQATIATLTVKLVTSMRSNPYTRPAACVCDNSPGTRLRHFPQSPCGGEILSSICSLTTVTPTVTRDTQNHYEQQLSIYGFHTSSSTSYKVLASFSCKLVPKMYDHINVLFVMSLQLGRTFAIQELNEVRSVRN